MKDPGIGPFIRDKRSELGWTQAALADMTGISRARISQIEGGRVTLPGADHRRRLAKALGVSHLDLLIAAGEITQEELQSIGAAGVVEREPDPMTDQLVTLARLIDWRQAYGVFTGLTNVLSGVLEDQRGARSRASGASDRE